jgi:hypothetical protein
MAKPITTINAKIKTKKTPRIYKRQMWTKQSLGGFLLIHLLIYIILLFFKIQNIQNDSKRKQIALKTTLIDMYNKLHRSCSQTERKIIAIRTFN